MSPSIVLALAVLVMVARSPLPALAMAWWRSWRARGAVVGGVLPVVAWLPWRRS